MQQIDTFKIKISTEKPDYKTELFKPHFEFSKDFDTENEIQTTADGLIVLSNRAVKQTYRLKENSIGITYINVDIENNEFIIQGSSKLLQCSEYINGITKNNVELICRNLNPYLPSLTTDEVLSAVTLRADYMKHCNYETNERMKLTAEATQLLKFNINYNSIPHEHSGIQMFKDVSSYKHYFKIYHKYLEMLSKAKTDNDIMPYLTSKDIAYLEKCFRFETEISNYEKQRKATGKIKGAVKFNEVLESKINIIYKEFIDASKYIPKIKDIGKITNTLFGNDVESHKINLMYEDLYKRCKSTSQAIETLQRYYKKSQFYENKKKYLKFVAVKNMQRDLDKAPEHLKILKETAEMLKSL